MYNMTSVKGYKIIAYDISLYSKLTEYGDTIDNYMCSMSFGTGNNKFCLTAIYKAKNPYEIYIDRVEKNDLCIINKKLKEIDDGMVKLVKLSLWFIKMVYPHVKKITLQDDSQIYCTLGSKMDKLSLAYDYIIKYNKTWYEKSFYAELPGLESRLHTQLQRTTVEGSLMDTYVKSLGVLDEPLEPFEIVANTIVALKKYRDTYNSVKTPREFINGLRTNYGDDYCKEVGKWLNSYMKFLQIKISPEYWFILTSNINVVPGFKVTKLEKENMADFFEIIGGKRQKGQKRQNKTLKNSGYSLRRGTFTESYIYDAI